MNLTKSAAIELVTGGSVAGAALVAELNDLSISKFFEFNIDDFLVNLFDEIIHDDSEDNTTTEDVAFEDTTEESDTADGESGSATEKTFKSQSLLQEHYEKHGQQIAEVLGKTDYSADDYLSDANYIINTGTYAPELNGYVSFMKGDKYGFVGLDRSTGNITTFHIKTISELIKKAPSLGLEK